MSVVATGDLACEYCGTKVTFSDAELLEYKDFRQRMLTFLKSMSQEINQEDSVSANRLWGAADTVEFETVDDSPINISYIYSYDCEDATVYVSRQAILYHFKNGNKLNAIRMEKALGLLKYPAADMKGLDRGFPKLTGRFELKNGETLLAFERRPNVFPVALFGPLDPVHAAWVVSRLENICCVLEYSQVCHGGISMDSVWIDATSHEVVLMGPWWNVSAMDAFHSGRTDLIALRKTAERIMGLKKDTAPAEFLKFIAESPKANAYDDFGRWDEVIEKGFGGHKFSKMDSIQY